MSSIEEQFNDSVETVKKYVNNIDNKEKAILYKYFKQSTIGDINIPKPTGFFNMINKQKWEEWNSLKGTDKTKAKEIYITFVNALKNKYK
tara:strand:- start:33 stop:302 length:270 start_codon:yes stop_codon:yes gene_type:complete